MASHPESVPDPVAAVFTRAQTFLAAKYGFVDEWWRNRAAHDLAEFAESEHAALVRERDALRDIVNAYTDQLAARDRLLAQAQAALEFYALPGMGDNGLRARQTLAALAGREG